MYLKELITYDPLFEFWVPGVFLSGGLISSVLIPKFLIYKCFINIVNKILIIPLPQLKALFIKNCIILGVGFAGLIGNLLSMVILSRLKQTNSSNKQTSEICSTCLMAHFAHIFWEQFETPYQSNIWQLKFTFSHLKVLYGKSRNISTNIM